MILNDRLVLVSTVIVLLFGCSTVPRSTNDKVFKQNSKSTENVTKCQTPNSTTRVINFDLQPYRMNAGFSGLKTRTEHYRQSVSDYYFINSRFPKNGSDLGKGLEYMVSYDRDSICGLKIVNGVIKAAADKNMGIGSSFVWEPIVSNNGKSISWTCRTNVRLVNQDGLCLLDESVVFE